MTASPPDTIRRGDPPLGPTPDATPHPTDQRDPADRDGGARLGPFGVVLAIVSVVLLEVVVWFLLRAQGLTFTGDSPGYLITARALCHLTINPLPAYASDMASHAIYHWTHGVTVHTPDSVHVYLSGRHGPVFAQGIGLPALLAPFMAAGSVPLALVGYATLVASGYVLLHQRASRLARLGRRGQLVFALVLAAPATWIAATQIYPDLLSGILLACAFVELALTEREGRLGRVGTAVLIAGLGIPPWLHVKNLLPVVIGLLCLAAIAARRHLPATRVIGVSTAVAALVGGLVVYNEYYFGHPEGLPGQGSTSLGVGSAWRIVALLVDRHQGLAIQVPAVLLGVLGLWWSRKRVPVAALGVLVAMAGSLVVNGSYTPAPFGGLAFAGRFEWTVAPMLVAWSAVVIRRLEPSPRHILALVTAILVLWGLEWFPIIRGEHQFLTAAVAPLRPWDPALYPGWWGGADRWLPTVVYPARTLAGTYVPLGVLLAAMAISLWLIARLCRPTPIRIGTAIAAGATLVGVAVAAVASSQSGILPPSTLTWSTHLLGGPWTTGPEPATYTPITLTTTGAGSFSCTVRYRLIGFSAGPTSVSVVTSPLRRSVVSHWLDWGDPTGAQAIVTRAPRSSRTWATVHSVLLTPTGPAVGRVVIAFTASGPRTASFRLTLAPLSHVDDLTVVLAKRSN